MMMNCDNMLTCGLVVCCLAILLAMLITYNEEVFNLANLILCTICANVLRKRKWKWKYLGSLHFSFRKRIKSICEETICQVLMHLSQLQHNMFVAISCCWSSCYFCLSQFNTGRCIEWETSACCLLQARAWVIIAPDIRPPRLCWQTRKVAPPTSRVVQHYLQSYSK